MANSTHFFDEIEDIDCQDLYPSAFSPDEYVPVHQNDIVRLHNEMHDCITALQLILELAFRDTSSNGPSYFHNLSLIHDEFVRIGNRLDVTRLKKHQQNGPGKNIQLVLAR